MQNTNYRDERSMEYNEHALLSPAIGGQGQQFVPPLLPLDDEASYPPSQGWPDDKKHPSAEGAVHERGLTAPVKPPAPSPKPTPVDLTKSIKFWTWFSPYRQMLFLVVIVEAFMILVTLLGGWHFARTHLSTLVTGNLLVAIAIRSEWVMRLLYWISIKLFRRWTPLKFRVLVVAVLYHIGKNIQILSNKSTLTSS